MGSKTDLGPWLVALECIALLVTMAECGECTKARPLLGDE